MAKHKKPALEIILTTAPLGREVRPGQLHPLGRLHGVGSSVVNALSSEMIVQVRRDSAWHEMRFSRGWSARS